jgi:hypothetical protein
MSADGFDLKMERAPPHVYLQWKGTNACIDFYCLCGKSCHFDGYFAYVVQCGYCDRMYEMPQILFPRLLETKPDHDCIQVMDISDEDTAAKWIAEAEDTAPQ